MFGQLFARLIKDEKGLSFILVSIGITALFGMAALVTDFGRVALARQQLVNAVDSAAMAGAHELTSNPDPASREVTARQEALDVAAANGAPAEEVTVAIDGNKVAVDGERTVELIMAKAFGVNSRTVHAHAAAVVGSVTSYKGIAPLCIREQAFEYGQIYTLKYGAARSGGDSPEQFRVMGNFGALALGGNGACTYRQNLIYGYNQPVKVGDKLETKTGDMNGPTDGIDQRLARCTDGCTYDNFKPGCPRVLVIPLHNEDDLHGRDEITVTGFAAFFVDRVSTGCADDEIKGYFVRMAAEGDCDPSQTITGLYGVKMIE
ncbi:MAG: pilus assembly protein [Peptococcaceae bacterium]|nr:pilus assembly protein [Peptococcaceae bacterium]